MLVCGLNEGRGLKKKSGVVTHRWTGHAAISVIHLNECLDVNPSCIRIRNAIRDGKRRFHAG